MRLLKFVLVVVPVTFAVFILEALFHYNIGRGTGNFHLPGPADALKIGVVVAIASIISGLFAAMILNSQDASPSTK